MRAERSGGRSSKSPTPLAMGLQLAITSSESALASTWASLKSRGRTALIPYLTAGYPTAPASLDALRAAAEVSDILEVGVPFSDPLADGPTIQRSTFEALRQGMTLRGTLDLIARARLEQPVVVFSYLNPVLRYGIDRFLRDAEGLGVAGVLLTDLPAGNDPAIESAVAASQLDLIRLVAPYDPAGPAGRRGRRGRRIHLPGGAIGSHWRQLRVGGRP